MSDRLPVLIVDDQAPFRAAMKAVLKRAVEFELVGEAASGREAVSLEEELHPALVLMDINMPEMSGIEATREITKLGLRSAVLVFTMHESKNLSSTVQDAGARGFVLKSHAARDLLDAIDALLNGGTFFGADGKSSKGKDDASNRGMNFRVSLRVGWAL